MEMKLSLLVAVHVALAAAFVLTSQMTSADRLPESSSDDVEWNGLDREGQAAAADKRKWGNNKARMWGKREEDGKQGGWGQKTSRLWGKRMDMDELARLLQDEGIMSANERAAELQDKRKWAKNKARMWGK